MMPAGQRLTEARNRPGMSVERVAATLGLTRFEVMYAERVALKKLNHMLTHHGFTLGDFLGRDAGVDEDSPFAGVDAPEIEA